MRDLTTKTTARGIKAAVLAGMLALGAAFAPSAAQADAPSAAPAKVGRDGVEIGILDCHTVPGSRHYLIVHSSVDLDCAFRTPNGIERYTGETGVGLGLDLSIMKDERMMFSVLTMGSDVRAGSHGLAGRYIGGQASAAFGVGLGTYIGVSDGQLG